MRLHTCLRETCCFWSYFRLLFPPTLAPYWERERQRDRQRERKCVYMRVCKRERKTQQTREQKIVCERESKNDSEGETASERRKQGCTLAFFTGARQWKI